MRTTEEVKALLSNAAVQEHRSLSSMLEHMVFAYVEQKNMADQALKQSKNEPKN